MTDMTSHHIQQVIKQAYEGEALWDILLNAQSIQAGPFDGGCLVCAQALIATFGGTLAYIANATQNDSATHYGALIDGIFYDFDGAHATSDIWINTFSQNENLNRDTLSVKQGLCPINKDIPFDDEATSELTKLIRSLSL